VPQNTSSVTSISSQTNTTELEYEYSSTGDDTKSIGSSMLISIGIAIGLTILVMVIGLLAACVQSCRTSHRNARV